jgi:hypothetical protein
LKINDIIILCNKDFLTAGVRPCLDPAGRVAAAEGVKRLLLVLFIVKIKRFGKSNRMI